MSNDAINWAIEQDIRAPAKPVLFVLANRANQEGICWPRHSLIAHETGYSASTIRNALAKLREKGLIEWKQQRDETGKGLTSNLYKLCLPPTTGDAIPLPHERTDPTTPKNRAPATSGTHPTARDGEKPKEEPTSKPKGNREPWQIKKDIEAINESISKIKEAKENQERWEYNHSGGFPILKEKPKERVQTLKQRKHQFEEELAKALVDA